MRTVTAGNQALYYTVSNMLTNFLPTKAQQQSYNIAYVHLR